MQWKNVSKQREVYFGNLHNDQGKDMNFNRAALMYEFEDLAKEK